MSIEIASPQIALPEYCDGSHMTRGLWNVKKFDSDAHHQAWLKGEAQPSDEVEFTNVFLLSGVNELWRLATGASSNTFTQANTQIGVGDSTSAAANTQTDLQAASNKVYKTSDSTGGITVGSSGGTNNALVVKATMAGTDANFHWQEMVVRQATSALCLNRAVQDLGTKASGTTWIAQCTLSIT